MCLISTIEVSQYCNMKGQDAEWIVGVLDQCPALVYLDLFLSQTLHHIKHIAHKLAQSFFSLSHTQKHIQPFEVSRKQGSTACDTGDTTGCIYVER